jgi:hypothetical protein
MMTAAEKLDRIATVIGRRRWGRTKSFGGADIMVLETAPPAQPGGFYPDPFFLETPFYREVSWLIFKIRDVAAEYEGYGYWKIALFPRLAAAGSACGHEGGIQQQLFAVLFEAYTFLTTLENEGVAIEMSPVSLGEPLGESYATFPFDEMANFYAARGIEILPEGPTSPE